MQVLDQYTYSQLLGLVMDAHLDGNFFQPPTLPTCLVVVNV